MTQLVVAADLVASTTAARLQQPSDGGRRHSGLHHRL
jgi:hypothetical protein